MSQKSLRLKKYNRWSDGNLPFLHFRNSHNELNRIYWANFASRIHTYSQTKGLNKDDQATILFKPTDIKHKTIIETNMTISMKDWCMNYNHFDNWTGLAMVMSLCSIIETYLHQSVEAAIASDPGIIIGTSKGVDGLLLLKKCKSIDIERHLISATKGDWPSRIKSLEGLFGNLGVEEFIDDLEKMRKLRNNFGHAFGRKIEDHLSSYSLAAIPTMNYHHITKFLEISFSFIKAIDLIISKHIGAFIFMRRLHSCGENIKEHLSHGRIKRIQEILMTLNCAPSKSYAKSIAQDYVRIMT